MSSTLDEFFEEASYKYHPGNQVRIELYPQGLQYDVRSSEIEFVAGFYLDHVRANSDLINPSRNAQPSRVVLDGCCKETMQLFLCWLPERSFVEFRDVIFDYDGSLIHADEARSVVERLVVALDFSLDKRMPKFMMSIFDLLLEILGKCTPSCLTSDVCQKAFESTTRFEAVRQLMVRAIIRMQYSQEGSAIDVKSYYHIAGFKQLYKTERATALASAYGRSISPEAWWLSLEWDKESSYKLPEPNFHDCEWEDEW